MKQMIALLFLILTGVTLIFGGCLEQKQSPPSLFGSEITKIEAHHNGHDTDYLYIHIIDGEAELKIGVDDGKKYIYQSAKKVPVEQISDELNSFTELFNRGVAAEHVEMPLERSMSSDYQIAIYLADGRHYLIAQVIDAPIQVENKTDKHAHSRFYLKPYSIDYIQSIKDIGTKAFDLQPPIQEKFWRLRRKRLLAPPRLRTVRESFPSYRSSISQPFLYRAAVFIRLLPL